MNITNKRNLLAVVLVGAMTLLGAELFTNAAGAAETTPDISVPAVRGKDFTAGATGQSGAAISNEEGELAKKSLYHEEEELAKKLLNPVAALISVPFIFLGDYGIGPDDGKRLTLSIQPVIPFELNKDWNLISRTLIPLMKQQDIPAGTEDSGLGDIASSIFFSPIKPTAGGWIWGAGAIFLLPTASEPSLGGQKWGIGPTALVLKQEKGWTYGVLVSQTWSVAGDDGREDVNRLFLQPFGGYTTPKGWNFSLWTETTYDWDRGSGDENATQLYVTVAKVVKLGGQLVQFEAGPNYWVADTEVSPSGWGWRANFVLLFPK
jgi:hypothetical protein